MNSKEQEQRQLEWTVQRLEAVIRLLARYYIQLGVEPALARRAAEVDFIDERNILARQAA